MSYNLRIIQEYFQPKIGRKIRIFSLGWKNNILLKKKECTGVGKVMSGQPRKADFPTRENNSFRFTCGKDESKLFFFLFS